ncbi:glutathione hydrolase-like YwrD proenzyme isoform X2 [Hydra vulgaris]|uniref:Glutathione hydrolase-like YwrD proenzyme isoform X2 n=1 Tax=Hydra vulgaris TaxID=6087 RepID=A0ABM4C5B2_HYDVU
MSDLENHSSTFDDLITVDYQGYKIWEMPPGGEGIIASMGLNIFEDFNLGRESRMSASCIHKMIEATNHVYGEKFRNKIDHSDEPPETILSKSHTEDARNISILNSIASSNYCPSINDGSIYFSVVDKDGNACSFINSLYHYFGSGLVPENCGFALQCRAMEFSLDEKHFNCVAPEKLPHHATIPGIATHGPGNDLYACFGLMGGYIQPQGHLQLLSNLIDYNMTPQSALCYPRVNVSYNYDAAPIVNIEQGISEEIVKQLIKIGHKVAVVSGIDRIKFGRGQIIQVQHDDQGNRVYWCGSDSRADGCAIGF